MNSQFLNQLSFLGLNANTLFQQAIDNKNYTLLNQFLENYQYLQLDLNDKIEGKNLLLQAIENDLELNYLKKLANFINPNEVDLQGNNALMLALLNNQIDLAYHLLSSINDLTIKNKEGKDALFIASTIKGSTEIIKKLLEKIDAKYDVVKLMENRAKVREELSIFFPVYKKQLEKQKIINNLTSLSEAMTNRSSILKLLLDNTSQDWIINEFISYEKELSFEEVVFIIRTQRIDLLDNLIENGWNDYINYENFHRFFDDTPDLLEYYAIKELLSQKSIFYEKESKEKSKNWCKNLSPNKKLESQLINKKYFLYVKANSYHNLEFFAKQNKINWNYIDNEGNNAYYYAKTIDMMNLLYDKSVNIEHVNFANQNCFLSIVMMPTKDEAKIELNISKLKWLIEKKANINFQNDKQDNAFSALLKINTFLTEYSNSYKENMFDFLLTTNIDKFNQPNIFTIINQEQFKYFINCWLKNGLSYEMILNELEDKITYQIIPLVNMLIKEGHDIYNTTTEKRSFLGIMLSIVAHYDNNDYYQSFTTYEGVKPFHLLKDMIAKQFSLTQYEMSNEFEQTLNTEKSKQCYQVAKMLQEKRNLEKLISQENVKKIKGKI